MSQWPATLPQSPFLGMSIQDDESRITSAMDAGPASVRNRFSAIAKPFTTRMVMTGAQLATFNTFYRTTLNNGTDAFDWTDPEDGASVSMRFKSAPSKTCIKSNPDPDLREWELSMNIEILP